jgi:Xaa-Pro aminopeptidase
MDRLQIAADWNAARLHSLRAEMDQSGLDGFIIPRWDAHQSEYVVIADERLAWATGFSGTWGLAIVTRDRAALFVDGRYTVQAQAEVSSAHFEQRHLYDEPLDRWLAEHAAAGEVYGYDPLILNPALHAQIEPAVIQRGASLRAASANPIDQAWSDRPETPIKPAFPFPVARSGETSLSKRQRLAERLRSAGADLLVETQTDNIAWLLNWRGDDVPDNPIVQAFMLVDATGGVDLFVDARKLGDDVAAFELDGVSLHAPSAFLERLSQRLKGGERVSMDPRFSPICAATAAREAGATVLIEADPLTALKAVKNPVELAGLRAASRRDSVAWVRFLAWLEAEVAVRPVSTRAARPRVRLETIFKSSPPGNATWRYPVRAPHSALSADRGVLRPKPWIPASAGMSGIGKCSAQIEPPPIDPAGVSFAQEDRFEPTRRRLRAPPSASCRRTTRTTARPSASCVERRPDDRRRPNRPSSPRHARRPGRTRP